MFCTMTALLFYLKIHLSRLWSVLLCFLDTTLLYIQARGSYYNVLFGPFWWFGWCPVDWWQHSFEPLNSDFRYRCASQKSCCFTWAFLL